MDILQKPEHDDKHLKFTLNKFHDNPAPKNALFLPSSRLPHIW